MFFSSKHQTKDGAILEKSSSLFPIAFDDSVNVSRTFFYFISESIVNTGVIKTKDKKTWNMDIFLF